MVAKPVAVTSTKYQVMTVSLKELVEYLSQLDRKGKYPLFTTFPIYNNKQVFQIDFGPRKRKCLIDSDTGIKKSKQESVNPPLTRAAGFEPD